MNRVKERKPARERARENTVNTVKCSVIVMYASQRPPSAPPP